MVTRRQIAAGSIVTGWRRLAGPENSFNWELDVSKAGVSEVTALVHGAGCYASGIGEAQLHYMKALKAQVGV